MAKAIHRRLARAFAVLSLLACSTAAADEFSTCKTGSLRDLGEAMKAHNEHVYRMNRKFKDVWYFQGQVPAGVGTEVTPAAIYRYLDQLAPRRAALLFHAMDQDRLCSWLFTPGPRKGVVRHLKRLLAAEMGDLRPSRWQELGVRSTRRPRVADRTRTHTPLDAQDAKRRWTVLLKRTGDMLLPPPIAERLIADRTDTLIVVPISIRSFRFGREDENDSATEIRAEKDFKELPQTTQLVFAVSTAPFLALPLGAGQVVDRMSVVVAPGFFPFAHAPGSARGAITAPLVVGAPSRPGLEPLPGAQAEVERIAADLQTVPLAGAAALKQRVLDELTRRAGTLDFVLLATHGRASEKNPIDGSYLEFTDGALTAREISRFGKQATNARGGAGGFPLRQGPVVILSACETGLGKSFAAGTIGLARAWQWAGASSVVMSVWSVDDDATRDLMIDLAGELRTGSAVDRALRKAAINSRRLDDNPALWAAFSVFGAPERLRAPPTRQGGT